MFGGGLDGSNEKKWKETEGRGSVAKCGKMSFEREGDCESLVRLSIYDGPMKTVEYIWVNIWSMLDSILSQNCKNTLPFCTVDQLVISAKVETLFYVILQGIRHGLYRLISDFKSMDMLLRDIYCLKLSEVEANSLKFKPEVCRGTEDFFVGRCHSNVYTMWKYYQKYIQGAICNECVVICRVFRRWCPVAPQLYSEMWCGNWMKPFVFAEVVVGLLMA